jgi:hypothetical protein
LVEGSLEVEVELVVVVVVVVEVAGDGTGCFRCRDRSGFCQAHSNCTSEMRQYTV